MPTTGTTFKRDVTAQGNLLRLVNDAHPTATHLAQNPKIANVLWPLAVRKVQVGRGVRVPWLE